MKKYITYIIILVLTVLAANYFYVITGLYKQDIKKCGGDLIFEIDSLKQENNILYFAESSNFTTAPGDSSQESISEILGRFLTKNNVVAINKSASHAGNYKKLIYRIRGSNVNSVIVTMNLRSFGINWIESQLETNLSRVNIIYSEYPPVIKKFLLAFKAYDNKALFQREKIIKSHYKNDLLTTDIKKFKNVRDWDSFLFSKGHLTEKGQRDAAKCELACHYVKNYAFLIKENNPRVKDFDDIIEFCNTQKIKVIINLLAENVKKAENLCGKELTNLMEVNTAFLKKRYEDRAIFVNNLNILSDSNYIDKLWPTEHYNYEGRKKIASNLHHILQK